MAGTLALITQGAVTIRPTQVLGYRSARTTGNLLHQIPGRPDPDITGGPAQLRRGTLQLGFHGATSEADSLACEAAHAASGKVFTFQADAERPTVGMYYVASGEITRELEEESRDAWIVSVDYQEITL
jgi:hypothetical protein